jgi:hypothetical protein
MISNIVRHKPASEKSVEWFEDKRAEDSVPEHRRPFQRSVPETVSSSWKTL